MLAPRRYLGQKENALPQQVSKALRDFEVTLERPFLSRVDKINFGGFGCRRRAWMEDL